MAYPVPVIRQIGWLSVLPQFLVIGLCIGVAWLILPAPVPAAAFLLGAILYAVAARLVRGTLTRDHRRGMRRMKAGDFSGSIPCFQASYVFFTRHEWLDRWRYLTLLSSSRMPYREMALCNIGFLYGQLGEGAKAKQAYERALQEFPRSIMASTALRMIHAAESMQAPQQVSSS